jgi:hypothetical protein
MNGIEAVEIIVEATQEQLHILDEVAQYVDPRRNWERKAWTEVSYSYRFSNKEDANLFRWLCVARSFRPTKI